MPSQKLHTFQYQLKLITVMGFVRLVAFQFHTIAYLCCRDITGRTQLQQCFSEMKSSCGAIQVYVRSAFFQII